MFFIYVLKSKISEHYYTGQTDDIEKRLKLHNNGMVGSSKKYKPWELIYREIFNSRKQAVQREKYLKSHAGRRWLKKYVGL